MVENEVSLVKINSDLYKEAAEIVELNQIDFPSIKNFVEVAVRNQLNSIKYNIENIHEMTSKDGKLKTAHRREFTKCIACDNLFLNEKEKNSKGKKVCPSCTKIIKNLNKFID